jgi:uncharacterized alpha-E superfamily protein
MLSRIADSLFWMNRYMERADNILRVLRTNYILSLDKDVNGNTTWKPALKIFTSLNTNEIEELENDPNAALYKLMLDTENLNSLKVIVTRARENARGVQDHITKEVWHQVNHMYHLINQLSHNNTVDSSRALEIIDSITVDSLLYAGVTDLTMPRGVGWSFMNLGRYIERCLMTIEITDMEFKAIGYNIHNNKDILQWRYLLLSLSGFELHLKNYRTANHNYNVLHQVLFNADFVRSLMYALDRIDKYFNDIVNENNNVEDVILEKYFGRLHSYVQFTDFDLLNSFVLRSFLAQVKSQIIEFSRRLGQNFFSYS